MKTTTVALQIRSASGRTFRRAGHDFTDAPRVLFIGDATRPGEISRDQADAIIATPALAVLELDQVQAADAAAALPKPAPSEAEIRQAYADRLEQLELKLMRLTAAGDAPAAAARIERLEAELAKSGDRIGRLEADLAKARKADKPADKPAADQAKG